MTIFKEKKQVVQLIDVNTGSDQQFDKPYLLLLREFTGDIITEETEFIGVPIRGRKEAFIYVSSGMGNYDLLNSYVMSGRIQLGQEVSLYTFMRLCIQNKKIPLDCIDGMTVDHLNSIVFVMYPELDEEYLERVYKNDLTSKSK